jgi:hypothetical protein
LALWRGEPLKGFQPGVVIGDRGEDVVDKGGVGTVSNGDYGVRVASSLMKGEALLTEVKAIFVMTLETVELGSRAYSYLLP